MAITPFSLPGKGARLQILVDADSCPKMARELVFRTAFRRHIKALFVANRPMPGISGEWAEMIVCETKPGAADDRIVELSRPGDMVITRDIPLVSRLVDKEVSVVDDRGRVYTKDNVREYLSLRNFMLDLAENNLGVEKAASYGKTELKAFADALDREITQKSIKKVPEKE
jgi:uncharacterized protein YaiI (UPF0178 family)